MEYPMIQPQLEYGTEGYCCVTAERPCRVTAYSLAAADEIRLVPDACEEIIVLCGGEKGEERKFCLRPDKTTLTYIGMGRGVRYKACGIRLEPGFTFDIGDDPGRIAESVFFGDSLSVARESLLRAVFPCIVKRSDREIWDRLKEAAVSSGGRATVMGLAERFGYTVRHINNIFNEGAGCGPKSFCRFVRFQNALLEMSKAPGGENSSFIERLSYADQAHFQREFKSFTGMTPKQFSGKYFMRKI